MTIQIPKTEKASLKEIFLEDEDSPFGAIDSNLQAWLQCEWDDTDGADVESTELAEHKDNQELINGFGSEETIMKKHTLQPQQIRYLAENEKLQTNGLSNLFFVYSDKENKLFIVGVVWDKTIQKFVPYIYRTRNLYRAWTKGNKIFVKK